MLPVVCPTGYEIMIHVDVCSDGLFRIVTCTWLILSPLTLRSSVFLVPCVVFPKREQVDIPLLII